MKTVGHSVAYGAQCHEIHMLTYSPDNGTNTEQIAERYFEDRTGMGYHIHNGVLPSPAEDGSYGTNGDAVFFFTTDDTYVEWRGDYMLCDKPLKLSTPPELTIQIKE